MFDFTQSVFDSREVIEAVEELELLESCALDPEASEEDIEAFSEEDKEELSRLRKFVDLADWVSDWEYGETFINDHYFTDYTEELVKDCFSLDVPDWVVIDWNDTAENVKEDYTEIVFEGETFYARN